MKSNHQLRDDENKSVEKSLLINNWIIFKLKIVAHFRIFKLKNNIYKNKTKTKTKKQNIVESQSLRLDVTESHFQQQQIKYTDYFSFQTIVYFYS